MNQTQIINVFYKPKKEKIKLGSLALNNGKIFFEYDKDFLKLNLEISPFKLKLQPGVIESDARVFDGLFGVFNDSLPDGWGRLLLDRKLISNNIHPDSLSPLDRLAYIGTRGMGALIYEPEYTNQTLNHLTNLDLIAREVQEFQLNNKEEYLDDLINLNGASTGARPKILINIEKKDWLIKFRSLNDPEDMSAIEFAYYLMAIDAGLDMSESKLFASKKGPGFFGTKRFDKNNEEAMHMHSLSGLLHSDHRNPCIDYKDILRATMLLTKDYEQCLVQFKHCAFNVLSHNRDDHSKNFAFLMDSSGKWKVSPAYDITFSSGPFGEHCSMIMGEGKNPAYKHLVALAANFNIIPADAKKIIDEVQSSINNWPIHAKNAGVSHNSLNLVKAKIYKK